MADSRHRIGHDNSCVIYFLKEEMNNGLIFSGIFPDSKGLITYLVPHVNIVKLFSVYLARFLGELCTWILTVH